MKTKEFDSVKMMREIRDKMSEEMMGMSFEERKAYIDARASRVREELECEPPRLPEAS